MRRNEKAIPDHLGPAGIMLKRNPGVTLCWTTLNYRVFRDGRGSGVLFNIGDPISVEYFAEGRAATRDEIMQSINSGMPTLRDMAKTDGPEAMVELQQMYDKALELVPA
jgi:hypothetical protein